MARGPSHPFFDLPKAIEMAASMMKYTGRPAIAPAEVIITEAWGYSAKSSSGTKSLAALRYFGLIENTQDSHKKSIKLTDRALVILLSHDDSEEKKQALKDAALSPKLYQYCWDKWKNNMPPMMRTNLLLSKGFAESSVDSFIRDYKSSIEFAGLSNTDAIIPDSPYSKEENENINDDSAIGRNSNDELTTPTQDPLVEKPDSYKLPQSNTSCEIPMRQATWPLDEGVAKFQWPAEMSHESLKRLEAWIELIKLDIKSSVKATTDPSTNDNMISSHDAETD